MSKPIISYYFNIGSAFFLSKSNFCFCMSPYFSSNFRKPHDVRLFASACDAARHTYTASRTVSHTPNGRRRLERMLEGSRKHGRNSAGSEASEALDTPTMEPLGRYRSASFHIEGSFAEEACGRASTIKANRSGQRRSFGRSVPRVFIGFLLCPACSTCPSSALECDAFLRGIR